MLYFVFYFNSINPNLNFYKFSYAKRQNSVSNIPTRNVNENQPTKQINKQTNKKQTNKKLRTILNTDSESALDLIVEGIIWVKDRNSFVALCYL